MWSDVRFLALFALTNSLVVGAVAAITAGSAAAATLLVPAAVAGLALTVRVVVWAPPRSTPAPGGDRRRLATSHRDLVRAAKEELP